MNTTIFLTRHGETEWNSLGKYQGCTDTDLSKEGIVQAQYLKRRFENDFDHIYTSPLKRAVKTAEIISQNSSIKPIIDNKLIEINFGDWEGLTLEDIKKNYPEEFSLWKNDEITAPLCGGELSLKNASVRAKDAIMEITKRHKGKRIIIVAHGGIIKAGLIGLFNWNMTMYHKIAIGNTSVCRISFDDNMNPAIITLNDTSHLPAAAYAEFR